MAHSKVTLQNMINTLKQQIEGDRVAKMQQELTIQDAEGVASAEMPKESKEALQQAASAAKIQLALIDRRLTTREPHLAELEKALSEATTIS